MPTYYNKKSNTWKYRTYVTDVFGNKKQIEKDGFKTQLEAELSCELEKANYNCDINNMKFSELYYHYEENQEVNTRPQSFRKTKSMFENHILPFFKDYKLGQISTIIYTKWKKEIEKKGFKYATNKNLHGAMVGILSYAVKQLGLEKNVASICGGFKRKSGEVKNVDFWTIEEYQAFITVVDDEIYKVFFETLFFTGLRLGECAALTWKDFKNRSLDINKTISKEKNKDGEYYITPPKTNSSIRIVTLDDYVYQKIVDLKHYYSRFIGFNDNWYIFGGKTSLAPTTIERKKNKWCELGNVKKIRLHDFRHSHATLLLSHGIPITVISKRLGHSDTQMTLNTYSHVVPKDEDKAIALLNQFSH